MSDLAKLGDVYSFGQFKADVSRGELEKAGAKIRLQEKPFRVLAILLEHPDEIVSREELRNCLWPADTFVEFDDGLNAAVKKLRIALGDSPDRPRFIETVPRRGYRFIAPVRKETPPDPPPVLTEAPPRRRHARSLWWIGAATVAAVLLGLIATGFAVRGRSAKKVQISSVAVLPLENLSHDEEQAFFADGMTDELITDLAKSSALRVISRTSVMHYKGTRKSIPEIARELNVDAIVEGTVSRSDNRILIRAQLVKAEPEQHIWAESYDRAQGDVVALQGELARDIAAAIRIKLEPEDSQHERPVDPAAHELYLKGRYFWNKRTHDGNVKAREYFQQAIDRDPNYAAAYAGLADTFAFGGNDFSIKEATLRAKAMAEKALALDSQSAEAHATLGLLSPQLGWDWQSADSHFKQAIALNPNFATAYQWHAEVYLATMGRMDEAIAEMRKAEQLDPLSPIIAADVGKMLMYARRYDEAQQQLQKALELDPNFTEAHAFLGWALFEKGMYRESLAELERIRPNMSDANYLSGLIAYHFKTGETALARNEMKQLLALARLEPVDPGLIASRYAMFGDKDNAFRWLNEASESGSAWIGSLYGNTAWDTLRSDPRFDEIRRRLHLL